MLRRNFLSNQSGFTLIEVAIVLAIIGVIIAGTYKGLSLLENARLKAIHAQVNEFRVATYTFEDQFGSLPGDYNKAHENINSTLLNGDNNGTVEGAELAHFWSHLKAANLLNFNEESPVSSLGGQYSVVFNDDNLTGLWFCLGHKINNNFKGGLFTPQQVIKIMNNNDNANPKQGRIQARDGSDANHDKCLKGDQLNMDHNKPTCILYFQL